MMNGPRYVSVPTMEMNSLFLSPVVRRQNSMDESSVYAPSTMTVSSRQNSNGSLNTCIIRDKRRHDRRRERLNTELLTAVMKGNVNDVDRLLCSGASPEATCRPHRVSACHVAAFKGYLDILGKLLAKGATGDERDKSGRQPMHLAAWAGHRDILDLLHIFKPELVNSPVAVDPGPIDMDIADSWSHAHEEFSRMLKVEFPEGSTPLHLAAQKVNKSCVDFLLRVNANVHCKDSQGLTPLDVVGIAKERPPAPSPTPTLTPSQTPIQTPLADDTHTAANGFFFRIQSDDTLPIDSDSPSRLRARLFKPSPQPTAPPLPTVDQCKPTHDVINALLDKGAKLPKANVIYKEGSVVNQSRLTVTALHTAVSNQDLELIGILLEKNACMMTWNENGDTAIHLAIKQKALEALKRMLTWEVKWPVVDVRDIKGRTPLHLAVMEEWADGVSFLLETGADVKTTTNDVETVLHLAAERGNYKMLQELLSIPDSRKMMEYRNKYYYTPLGQAVYKKHLACVELLCENGADITNGLPGDFSLVHIAAENDSPEIIEYLLREDAVASTLRNVRSRPEKGGVTALHLAAKAGNTRCAEELLKAGCDFLLKTSEEPEKSSTALHLAAKEGFLDIVDTILKYDQNKEALKAKDGQEWYPLHVAAVKGHGRCVKSMLLHGADIAATIPDESGLRTGLDIINYCVPQPNEFLVDIFDSYIESNGFPVNDPECEIEVKYDILIPDGTKKKQMKVLNALLNSGRQKLQEELLLHPIVETFLCLKWRKLRVYYFLLMTFFILFTLSLTVLSLLHYVIKEQDHVAFVTGLAISRTLLIVCFIPIVLAEAVNVFQLQKYYLRDYESGVKWFVFLGTWAVGIMDPGGEWARYVAAVTVLLAWIELLFLLARFPSWGFYALMFSKVAKNVVKVMGTFTFILIGFTFAFMIHHDGKEPFHEFWEAFVKVVVMMIEPDYAGAFPDGEEFSWNTAIGRAIFLTFVILIAIVLMNLMVGLAVSDISILEAQGRTERLAKQIGFLSLLELFVYNDPVLRCLPRCLRERLEFRRCVSTSVIIRPATPLNSVFQQLPREIRESVLEKVAEQQCHPDSREVNMSLHNLDSKIEQLAQDMRKRRSSTASHSSLKSHTSSRPLSELDSIKLTLNNIMKTLAELRDEVHAQRNNNSVENNIGYMYQRPEDTIINL